MSSKKEKFTYTDSSVLDNLNPNNLSELNFISELGRNLLFAIHPQKVAAQVAEKLQKELSFDLSAVAITLSQMGLVSCAYDDDGENTLKIFQKKHFHDWLNFSPLKGAYISEDKSEFFLNSENHNFEYVSPLNIYGEAKGALVVGFSKREDLTDSAEKLIEAVTQMTAMSLNHTVHYESAMSSTINETRHKQQKYTENVLDALPVSLYVIDSQYRIVTWNRHCKTGKFEEDRDSVIGKNVFEVFSHSPTETLQREFKKVFETGEIHRLEQQATDENGGIRHWVISKIPMFDDFKNITHIITIGEDVTSRVEAIHAVGRAEKLSAVGRLAAGVVHEINNPLATISACAESLELRLNEGAFNQPNDIEDLSEYLKLISSEAFRCKSITNGLLEFSRGKTGNYYPVDIKHVIESATILLKHQKRGNNIDLQIKVDDDLPHILANKGQIQQAIIALSTNAIDAMPNGGKLTFRAFKDKNQIVVKIEDTGTGIKTEHLSKIYEPFFTTKEVGKGTGLGLAVCYGIITDHQGRLAVRSKEGVGTTFIIYLPVKDKN